MCRKPFSALLVLSLCFLLLTASCRPPVDEDDGDTVIDRIFPQSVYPGSPPFTVKLFGNNFPDDALVRVNGALVPVVGVYYDSQIWFTLPSIGSDIASDLKVDVCTPDGVQRDSISLNVAGNPLDLRTTLPAGPLSLAHDAYASADYDVTMVVPADGEPVFHLLIYGKTQDAADGTDSSGGLYYVHSSGEDAFGAPMPIRVSEDGIGNPCLAVDGLGVVHAVWNVPTATGTEMFYSRSVNQGDDWSTPRLLSRDGERATAFQLLCTRDNRLIVSVWATRENETAISYAVVSRDQGESWHWGAIDFAPWFAGLLFTEDDEGNLLTSFYSGESRVVVKKSNDGGINWSKVHESQDQYFSWPFYPRTFVFRGLSGQLYLGWSTTVIDRAIVIGIVRHYLSSSTDYGESWGQTVPLHETLYGLDSFSYRFHDDGQVLYALGTDRHFVVLSRSVNGGSSWTAPQFLADATDLPATDSMVSDPRLFINGDRLYVFYRARDGVRYCRLDTR